uniref:Solute-binding protein family 3/N-terminal domain-containing protein n=1 Tax=Ananas comosus var. bracteatus TaxID=296719 RepID=A0A6V7P3X2_ANACO|nr:unnamed protein product [Ananas comosus var. bracteatus]
MAGGVDGGAEGVGPATSGAVLRIAVPRPADPAYHRFRNVETDAATNRTTAGGFVIDVFEAAVRKLPYALRFEYVPADVGLYNTLVQQVANGSYDAAVADMTIS